MHLQLGEVSAVVISSRDAAKRVLKDQDPACADRPESIATKIMWATSGNVLRDQDTLLTMMKKGLLMTGGFELADLFPSSKLLSFLCWNKYKLLRMHRKIDKILDAIIEDHKLKQSGDFGGEDIIDVLLRMKKSTQLKFPITNENIKALIFVSDD
ncbi:hypothetical protein BUALT_Bualt13G0034400 [Buddleja alternifolia]|uniref:Uncharacterized protein n=1 Tax=Buddleja alternifolia TaxID=168488 RepID=A0AAV6WLG4_9LAMI|nr:hypothetical protein BUALT_Bualt13G0034400 [Buddleja alternifolia]